MFFLALAMLTIGSAAGARVAPNADASRSALPAQAITPTTAATGETTSTVPTGFPTRNDRRADLVVCDTTRPIPIELVQLDLVSVTPIRVDRNGPGGTWSVRFAVAGVGNLGREVSAIRDRDPLVAVRIRTAPGSPDWIELDAGYRAGQFLREVVDRAGRPVPDASLTVAEGPAGEARFSASGLPLGGPDAADQATWGAFTRYTTDGRFACDKLDDAFTSDGLPLFPLRGTGATATTTTTRPPIATAPTTKPGEGPGRTVVAKEPQRRHGYCWWCWGIKGFLVLFLVCVLVHHVRHERWWRWWFLWLVLAFFWLPFLLAGLVFLSPWWWWLPILGWFPAIGAGAWCWARRAPWWRPWMWWVAGGWAGLIGAGLLVWSPRWWFLLPVLWVPWILAVVFGWGFGQRWWRWWMWPAFAGFAAWVFAWLVWLTPGWGWVIPWLWVPVFVGWFLIAQGDQCGESWGPKLCFFAPWIWFPWFAWQNLLWDPWWCFVFVAWFVLILVCVLWHWTCRLRWWVWWGFWLLIIFLWIPLLLAGLAFWASWWWWLPILGWFPALGAASWCWARRAPWWRPWMWWVAGGWAALIGAGLLVWSPRWWFLLPVLWIPWALGALWWSTCHPWWRWWMVPVPLAYAAWVFSWVIWLSPAWWWIFPLFLFPVLGGWWWWRKETWSVVGEKLCFVLPWAWLPPFVFGIVELCYDLPLSR